MFTFPSKPWAVLCLALGVSASAEAAELTFDKQQIRTHIATLASDEYGGRGPLTRGETLSIDYIAQEFAKLGLKPGNGDSYLQPVPLAQVTADQGVTLKLGQLELTNGSEFTARTQRITPRIEVKDSPMVFVGYGINAPEYGWNDYAGLDVRGKTVVMLVNDPGFATQDPTLFKGNAMTYYGRWTYKYEEAARQGAAAALIIHQTDAAGYAWGVVQNSNTGSKYTLVDASNNASELPVMGWLHQDAAHKLFKQSRLDLAALSQAAAQPGFKPVTLTGTASIRFDNTARMAESHNVLGLLPGSEMPEEVVMIHAHWDHLGTNKSDGHIYNGAIDNATGVAGVIELARVLSEQHRQAPFKRSILFSSFTAEETGLIGASHFATHPTVPAGQIVAFLNIDGMNVDNALDYILRYGDGVSELEGYLERAARSQGRTVRPDPRPQAGLLYRSDHFALAKVGVPGLLFMSLGDNDPDYIPHRYHKPADDYHPDWSLEGMAQDLSLMAIIAAQLANNGDWPKWLEASEFRKRRALDGRQ
ncbi:M28 family peptidase [Ferrimonas sediminicola]|uniref:M28 family peptidase n=1 Tax=Ferrimonas sediminicola TaxID=2569538 RepID=A0A4U1BEV5_9GAMM|nr:M28 family metallopeptidase [Ferrimonas sediminicola]TKB49408.1 M28 family peptidase [Ferrimonas sediminicola]